MKPTGTAPNDARNQPKPVLPGKASDRATLAAIAHQAMVERGLEPDFPLAAQKELAAIGGPAKTTDHVRDRRNLLWASIDNDDSRDLDQLTVAEPLAGGQVRILVAVADVDALVCKGSSLDAHAARNTTSVYTPAAIFPMLPEALSTNLTSLNEDQDRIAIVADMVFKEDGSLVSSELYRAPVRNRAKLAYHSVAAWLTGTGPAPKRIAEVSGLDENLRLQDRVAHGFGFSSHRPKADSRSDSKALQWATTFVSNSFTPMSNVVS
jgi:exoribonuclease R